MIGVVRQKLPVGVHVRWCRSQLLTITMGGTVRTLRRKLLAASVVEVAPGADELAACLVSGATRCHLLPGVHREAAIVAQVGESRAPIEITGAPGSVLSGAVPVPGPWTRHKGRIFKAQLPVSLRGQDIQQAWAGQTWLPEARWPNANLTAGGTATTQGGPLSLSSWATSYGRPNQTDNCTECTRLREGVIVDPELAKTGIDFTGALATLNVGFRFLTWTRRVLTHEAGSSSFHYNQTTPKGQKGLVGGSGHYLDKGLDNRYFLSGVLAALDVIHACLLPVLYAIGTVSNPTRRGTATTFDGIRACRRRASTSLTLRLVRCTCGCRTAVPPRRWR